MSETAKRDMPSYTATALDLAKLRVRQAKKRIERDREELEHAELQRVLIEGRERGR